jgi:hypothetical protein
VPAAPHELLLVMVGAGAAHSRPRLGLGRASLHESNPLAYTGRGSEQRDYYKLENRERKLAAVEFLDADEAGFILGNAEDEATRGSSGVAAVAQCSCYKKSRSTSCMSRTLFPCAP